MNHSKKSSVHSRLFVFIGGSDKQNGDYSRVLRYTRQGGMARWSSLKGADVGDGVLIYITRPHSALVAEARVLERAKKTSSRDRYPYRAKVGCFKLLPNPVSIGELKQRFPKWDRLRFPRRNGTVPVRYRDELLRLVHQPQKAVTYKQPDSKQGGGFGGVENNRLLEKAAVNFVSRYLRRHGYRVVTREVEKVGYDLEAQQGRRKLHVEVKGVSGKDVRFLITRGEFECAKLDPVFRLFVVTEAGTRRARIHRYRGASLRRAFTFKPVSYFASQRQK